MAILSKPVVITGIACSVVGWAVWYDRYRRNKPDYKTKLVEKRRNEIIKKREESDPFSYIKTISLCENPMDRQQIAMYTMEQTGKGEVLLDQGQHQKGAAHIAMGMAYMEQAQIQMVLSQLSMQLPQGIIQLILQFMRVAKGRTNAQMMEQMFKKQDKQERGDMPAVSARKNDEPEDVDSIDGDSEEKIVEIIEDDNKSETQTLDDVLDLKEVDETAENNTSQQLVEDDISDDEQEESNPQPSAGMQESQFTVISQSEPQIEEEAAGNQETQQEQEVIENMINEGEQEPEILEEKPDSVPLEKSADPVEEQVSEQNTIVEETTQPEAETNEESLD